MNRRTLLAAVGGGAAAWAGLRFWVRRPPIAGRIVGASHDVGHRIRGDTLPPPSASERVDVAIFGAGIAGLAAAWRLRRLGIEDFAVYDLEAAPGGNARSGANDVSAYPWGAHYVPSPPASLTHVCELFRDLGVITGESDGRPVFEERHLCFDPQERIFADGAWREGLFPSAVARGDDLDQWRDFQEAVAGLRRQGRFRLPVDAAEPNVDLDRMSMREYLDRAGWTSPRLRWCVEYGCRDDYGCSLETTSAWAGVHYFAARTGAPLLTWPEGNGWIVRRLAEPLGDRLRCGRLVARVFPEADRVVAHVVEAGSGRVTEVHARRAIYALPQYTRRHVVGDEAGVSFTYAPWMVANLTVDRMPEGRGAEPAWDNVLYDSPSLGYVVATHQSLSLRRGPTVLTYYRPFTGPDPAAERRAILARPWEGWRDEILADLSAAHPGIADTVRSIDVMVWGHAMIRPVPGFLWGGARRAAARPVGALHFANSDLGGLPLFEEALQKGVEAGDSIG